MIPEQVILLDSPDVHKTEKIFPFCVFMEVTLHKPDWLNHWLLAIDSNSSSSPLPRDLGRGTNSSNLLIICMILLPYLPYQGLRSHLIKITKDTFITLITQEIPGVLGALGQKRYKDEMYISYYTLQYHKYAFQIDVMLDGKFHINLNWVMASKRVKHHIAR